jgi:hypothetical protein
MADRVQKINYCYVTVPSRSGQGAKVLGEVAAAGINMLAFSGFPARKSGSAQLDILLKDVGPVRRLARKHGWTLSPTKKCFLIQGSDQVGAVHRHLDKLAKERISVTAADAVTTGKGQYGMILWVKPRDYQRAARALGAR